MTKVIKGLVSILEVKKESSWKALRVAVLPKNTGTEFNMDGPTKEVTATVISQFLSTYDLSKTRQARPGDNPAEVNARLLGSRFRDGLSAVKVLKTLQDLTNALEQGEVFLKFLFDKGFATSVSASRAPELPSNFEESHSYRETSYAASFMPFVRKGVVVPATFEAVPVMLAVLSKLYGYNDWISGFKTDINKDVELFYQLVEDFVGAYKVPQKEVQMHFTMNEKKVVSGKPIFNQYKYMNAAKVAVTTNVLNWEVTEVKTSSFPSLIAEWSPRFKDGKYISVAWPYVKTFYASDEEIDTNKKHPIGKFDTWRITATDAKGVEYRYVTPYKLKEMAVEGSLYEKYPGLPKENGKSLDLGEYATLDALLTKEYPSTDSTIEFVQVTDTGNVSLPSMS